MESDPLGTPGSLQRLTGCHGGDQAGVAARRVWAVTQLFA
jgi:hypothetical protein